MLFLSKSDDPDLEDLLAEQFKTAFDGATLDSKRFEYQDGKVFWHEDGEREADERVTKIAENFKVAVASKGQNLYYGDDFAEDECTRWMFKLMHQFLRVSKN